MHLGEGLHAQIGHGQPREIEERHELARQRVHGRRRRGRLQDRGRRVEDGVLTVLGHRSQLAHVFDARSGDVADALAHRIDGTGQVGELDDELVDGHAGFALEHLEPDDVALDRPDLRGHRSEDARSVGQPDPHAGQHGGCIL